MVVIDGSAIQNQVELLGGQIKLLKKDNTEWKYAVFFCDCNLGQLYDFFDEWDIEYQEATEQNGKFIVKFKDKSYSKPYSVTDSKGQKKIVFAKDEQTAAKYVMDSNKEVKQYLVRFADASYKVSAKSEQEAVDIAHKQYKLLKLKDGSAANLAYNVISIVNTIKADCEKLERSEPESPEAKAFVTSITKNIKEVEKQYDKLISFVEHWI